MLCVCLKRWLFFKHAAGSRVDAVGRIISGVCLSVCPHDSPETDTARITKLDPQMSHNESRKPIYFGIQRSSRSQRLSRSSDRKQYIAAAVAYVIYSGFSML